MRPRFLRVTIGLLTLSSLSALTACGDDDPTGPSTPNLVGVYDGTWTTTVEGEGLDTTIDICPGTVSIDEQSSGVFEGTFSQAQSEDCGEGSGFVTGTITPDGSVTVLLGASGGGGPAFEESTGCTIQSAEGSYRGTYEDGELAFDTSLTARCPDSGDTDVLWTFAFAGS
jgi:hypothetical protein